MTRTLAALALGLALVPGAVRAEDDPTTLYNDACTAALAGERDRAFARLDAALSAGFGGCAHLAQDPDLVSLHADPRWNARVARCEETKARSERFWEGAAWKAPFAEELPEADRLAGLARVWSEAKFGFANFALVPDLDWDAEFRAAVPRALAARTTEAYYRVLQELMAKLRDGHSAVWLPKELQGRMQAWPAVATRVAGGRVLLAEVLDPALGKEGMRPGLEILEVDGVPVRTHAAGRVSPAVSASTPQDLEVRTFERRLLDGAAGTPVRLTLSGEDGRTFTRTLVRLAPAERAKLLKAAPLVSLEKLAGGIARVTIRSFADAKVVGEFEKLLPEIAGSRALILDVRENGGGNSGNGDRILSMITKGSFPAQTWWTRDYRPAMRAWGMPESRYARTETLEGSAAPAFAGRAVLLVGPRTYSAAEDFTVAFRDAKRGQVLGEPTGGSTGQPLRFALPGGGAGYVCTKRNTLADGTEFVGKGIVPDVTVPTSFEDVRAGRDPVLDAAVKLLSAR